MIPFRVVFRPGVPLHEQVVYAAKKAIVSGRLHPGEAFPSVRTLSKELKINPNTAHKVVTQLVATGLLEARAGIGTVVASLPEASKAERTSVLGSEIEQVVVEAIKLGVSLDEFTASVAAHWKELCRQETPATDSSREGKDKR